MAGRIVLAVLLFVTCGPVVAQAVRARRVQQPLDELEADKPMGPVVTLGSTAMAVNGDTCKAVGFTADGRMVNVFTNQRWHRWEISTGQSSEFKSGSLNSNDTLYPGPDGQTILCMGRSEDRNGKVRVVDLKGGSELRSREFSKSDTILPSDDCTCIATVGTRGTNIIWLDDKLPGVRVEGVTDVRRFAKAAGASVFALLGDDRVAVQTAAGVWKLDPPKDTAYTAVALNSDGTTLATASARETDDGKRPGPIELWDVKARKMLRAVEAVEWFSEAPYRLRFTPDGTTLVAGDGAYLRGWNTTTGATTFAVEPGWGWVGNVQISPDGKYVAVAYPSRPMVYELATGRQPTALLGHSSAVWDIAFSPDGTRAATAMYGRPMVYLWDTTTGKNLGELKSLFLRPKGERIVPGRVRVQFSPDGTKLLTTNEASGTETPIRIWDAQTLGLLREIPAPAGDVSTAAFTRHGLFAILDGKPTLLDPATGKAIWEKPPVPRAAKAVISRGGARVAVEGRKEASVWDLATGREIDRVPGEPVRFTADSGLVFEGKKHAIRFRDLDQKSDRLVFENSDGVTPTVSETGFVGRPTSPSNQSPEFHVHSARDGRLISTCEGGHTLPFGGEGPKVSYSRDGRTLAVAGQGGTIHAFETYSGQELFQMPGGPEIVALTFSPDGRTLFYSRGGDEQHSQVSGHDTTGGAWGRLAVARPEDVDKLRREIGDKPAPARKALYQLATRPPEAVAFAREVTQLATAADYANHDRWLADLDAPAFTSREAATKALAKAGWRAEAAMRTMLDKTESVEARNRLEKLLARRDVRPLRAVHLLELVGSPEAVGVLKTIATGPPESLVVQDAKWSLLRLGERGASAP
ncbi:WD40 repeat domain-containing protein [Limnoglobus roseus]|uniref:WD-40 repeat protein n=1 Tax=Limnoglobus roseus TaxID=2598579 RepID=A0A5C1ACJ3_9BACT|nr:PQQ-binding-like beta-propeller repeat protein [Limnoglobus roseus]QEL15857.1 WD-40 repeat protein [Limnoglobus roseus]